MKNAELRDECSKDIMIDKHQNEVKEMYYVTKQVLVKWQEHTASALSAGWRMQTITGIFLIFKQI